MAIDTRDKRSSVLGWGLPMRGSLPTPDSTIGAPERRDLGQLYSGIAVLMDWTIRASMVGYTFPYLRPVGPWPDVAIGARDRQLISGLYHRIDAASPSGTVIILSRSLSRALNRALGRNQ